MTALYWIVCGASAAYRAGEIALALSGVAERVLVLQTPGSRQVISPRELARACERAPGLQLVDDYFDRALTPQPARAPVLIAPCTFNTLNKFAAGIADSLALSIAAEMLGRGQRVTVAASMNDGLWSHPRARQSVGALRAWGVTVIEPRSEAGVLTLAPTPEIIAALNPAGFALTGA